MRVLKALGLAATICLTGVAVSTIVEAAPQTRDRAVALVAEAEGLVPTNPAVALDRSRAALTEIERLPADAEAWRLKANAVWLEAQALNRLNRLDEAREVLAPVLTQVEKAEPGSPVHAELLYTLASILQKLGNVQESFSTLKTAFSFYEESKDSKGQAKSLVLMASLYRQAGNFKKSIEYYDQAANIYSGDRFFNLAVFNNRANSYRDMGQNGKAREDFIKSLQIARDFKNPGLICQVLSNLAYAEISEGRFEEAKSHIDEALSMIGSAEEQTETSYIQGVYAFYWWKKGDFSSASEWMDRAFRGVRTTETTPPFKDFHRIAAEIYERSGRYNAALDHQKAFKRLDDQARELMVNTNSALVAAQFDFANQDLRIARLKADQLQKDAELARSRNRITLILLGGSVLTAGLMGFNFLSLRRSSRRIEAANTRLNDANESLERALKAKSEFLATTSHEIRTPLNGILGVTQVLLADPRISPEVRDRVTLMHGAGETMRALVNDILDAAKIESGTLTIEKGDTDLAGLLDDAVQLWTDKAEEKGLSLRVERAGAPARIIEDGPRLRQIVFNLLSNAIKFTDQGSVRLSAGVERAGESDRLVVRVADSGIGIPADQVETIFESFRQVDGGVTRRFGGTGLGLSISRDLAEAMGGTLGVESELGKGSTFTLTLPLVLAAKAADGAGEGPCPAGDVFLIIEANPLTQSVLKSVVAPLGIAPETVGALDAAVSRLSEGGVGGVLVDAAGLGAETPERLEAIARLVAAGARRIAVTWPSPDEDLVRSLLAAGATQVIAKPISAAKLTAALKEGLAAAA